MIEVVGIIAASLTAITCSSLWFVSVIDKRSRAAEAPEERVLSYRARYDDCALCGQATDYLNMKIEGAHLR